MSSQTSILAALSLGTLCVLGAATANGQQPNLLGNGDFRENLAGWSRAEKVSWSAFGAGSRGSAKIGVQNDPTDKDVLVQCVAVEGYRLYDLGASVYLPSAPRASGALSVRLAWYPEPDCQGGELRGLPALEFPFAGSASWQTKELRRTPAPEAAQSAVLLVLARAQGPDEYAAFIDDLFLRRSVEEEAWIVPNAASVTGARGERFRTDVVVHNPTPAPRTFALRFRDAARPGVDLTPVVLHLAPRESRVLEDVLADVLGARGKHGALEIVYVPTEGPIRAEARVVTTHPESPGNGASLPVVTREEARTSAEYLGLELPEAGSARVNAGVYNPSAGPVDTTIVLRDAQGEELGRLFNVLPGYGWLQENDLLSRLGGGADLTGASLVITAMRPVHPWVITVDNRSGDGTVLPPVDLSFR